MKTKVVVMGVSGCGKSSIGKALAKALDLNFFDGDDYHSQSNIEKMQSGAPLTDDDRQSWLLKLSELILEQPNLVLACSALKPEYRNILRRQCSELQFVYLKGDFDTIWSRMSSRKNHYFKGPSMLESQFKALVEPSEREAIHVSLKQAPKQMIQEILAKIKAL
ncbi:gluconokinase [Alginatibacterium sediminis]|uniref:Gluconokinase n=1 Tax=Alginatibacterium sediminis TaxID=2164068 RepID=A0A420EBA3_9ALTE|nr:gluconokinase [Alginatibacterium sediminis]RKF17968.1 gluconokinase [Alginatibacterium sediminis]